MSLESLFGRGVPYPVSPENLYYKAVVYKLCVPDGTDPFITKFHRPPVRRRASPPERSQSYTLLRNGVG